MLSFLLNWTFSSGWSMSAVSCSQSMPLLNQFLWFTNHLIPVIQLSASGIHKWPDDHESERYCREKETDWIKTKVLHFMVNSTYSNIYIYLLGLLFILQIKITGKLDPGIYECSTAI